MTKPTPSTDDASEFNPNTLSSGTDEITQKLFARDLCDIPGLVVQMSAVEQNIVLLDMALVAQTEQECSRLKRAAKSCPESLRKMALIGMREDASDGALLALWDSLCDDLAGIWDPDVMSSCLKHLCEAGRDSVMKEVLIKHPHTNVLPALILAIVEQQAPMVVLLVGHLENRKREMDTEEALKMAIVLGNNHAFDLIFPLLQPHMNYQQQLGLLNDAAANGRLEMVRSLVQHGERDIEQLSTAILSALTNNHAEVARFLVEKCTGFGEGKWHVGVYLIQAAETCADMVVELLNMDNTEQQRLRAMSQALVSWNFGALDALITHQSDAKKGTDPLQAHKDTNIQCLDNAYSVMQYHPKTNGYHKGVRMLLDQMSWDDIEEWIKDKNTSKIEWLSEIKKTATQRHQLRVVLGVDEALLPSKKRI